MSLPPGGAAGSRPGGRSRRTGEATRLLLALGRHPRRAKHYLTGAEKSMVLSAREEVLVPSDPLSERSNAWLRRHLTYVWDCFFPDIPQTNGVEIEFARRWKTRLGMISLSESRQTTYIGINALLRDPLVPESVCTITIAHELVHYAHGFGSPLPRKYTHPHHGNVVTRELMWRGLGKDLQQYKQWISHHWYTLYYSTVSRAADNGSGSGKSKS